MPPFPGVERSARLMVHELFVQSGRQGEIPTWKQTGYAHWIENDPGPEFTQQFLDDLLVVRQGEMPDDLTWLLRSQ